MKDTPTKDHCVCGKPESPGTHGPTICDTSPDTIAYLAQCARTSNEQLIDEFRWAVRRHCDLADKYTFRQVEEAKTNLLKAMQPVETSAFKKVCRWKPIEDGSLTYEPGCCREWWTKDEPGVELYPHCHWCGGEIEEVSEDEGSSEEPSPCMGMWHVPVITCAKCGTALKQCSECRVISGHRYDCSTQKAPGRASLACVHRDGCRKFPACMVEARCCGNDASIPETR